MRSLGRPNSRVSAPAARTSTGIASSVRHFCRSCQRSSSPSRSAGSWRGMTGHAAHNGLAALRHHHPIHYDGLRQGGVEYIALLVVVARKFLIHPHGQKGSRPDSDRRGQTVMRHGGGWPVVALLLELRLLLGLLGLGLLLRLLRLAVGIRPRHRLAGILILHSGRGWLGLRGRRGRRIVETAPSAGLRVLRQKQSGSGKKIDRDQAKTGHSLLPRTRRSPNMHVLRHS